MASFVVAAVVDGDTFVVDGGWTWDSQRGDRVRPTGYDAPETGTYGASTAKQKLQRLVLNKVIEIKRAYKVDRGRLVADVYLDGVLLSAYFPEYGG